MNIVVKLPNDLNERILAFPFLHLLFKTFENKLEEDEFLNLHLICLKDSIDVLNLLPFKAFYHEVEKEDLKTIFTVHRAIMNLKIDQVDYFISTTDSFVDASIGKNLSAKEKIGFALGKNAWVLTKKVSKLAGRHHTEQIFELLTPFVEELPEIPTVYSRDLPPFYADYNENPYTIINLNIQGESIHSEWNDFFDLFVNQNFILMCTEADIAKQADLLDDYIKELPTKNTYKTFSLESYIDFGKIVNFCKLIVSFDSPIINLSAYCGVKVVHLNQKMDIRNCGPQFFGGDIRHFSLKDPAFKQGNDFNYSKIFDELYGLIEDRENSDEEIDD